MVATPRIFPPLESAPVSLAFARPQKGTLRQLFCKVELYIQHVQVILNLLCCFIFCKLSHYWLWNPTGYLWIVCFPSFQLNSYFLSCLSIGLIEVPDTYPHILLSFKNFTTHSSNNLRNILPIQLYTNRLKIIIHFTSHC